MKVLLVSEYSRLHNSLKEGLESMGIQVTLAGFNDGFKNYPADYIIHKKWDSGLLKFIKILIYKLTRYDISSYLTYKQFSHNKELFSGYDIVQLINENSFFCNPKHEKKILEYIFNHNKAVFLLATGDDYSFVNYNFLNPKSKSTIQPYLEHKIKDKDFSNVLKFKTKPFEKLHLFITKYCHGIISTDFDYYIPVLNHRKHLGLIPNPINIDKILFHSPKLRDKTVIFLGINRDNYYKKGIDFFEEALTIIQKKYSNKVEIINAENVPYNEYINLYNKAHILLDQCYSKDQGYNALEAMAKGKVVFTGAEKEFLEFYGLHEDEVAINALPNVDYLVEKLSFLIENPQEIIATGRRARAFIEKEHDYIKIAEKYLKVWTDS